MDGIELGKKIKEARIAKKMTQSDVVGTFITRNMLSQIESGSAYPSIKTLEYLAKVLELPINYLMHEQPPKPTETPAEIAPEPSLSALTEAKSAYTSGRYADAVELALELSADSSPLSDEGEAILARSYLELAKNEDSAGNTEHAAGLAKKAAASAGRGIYKSRDIKTGALLLLDKLTESMD